MKSFKILMMAIVGVVLSLSFTLSVATLSPKLVYAQESAQPAPAASSSLSGSVVKEAPAAAAVADEVGLPKVENQDFVKLLIESVGGFKGAKILAIAFMVSKLLLFFILSPFFMNLFPKLESGGMKLFIAVSLNLVVGILGLMVSGGLSFGAALVHSTTLAMASVFANQAYKQFFVKAKS